MATIEGTSGDVKFNATSTGKLTSITITIEQETSTQGPYIGDPTTDEVRAGLSATVAGEGIMETPTNAGQQEILDAILAGTDVATVIEIGDPAEQTFTCATLLLTSVEIGLDTGEGAPISFEGKSKGTFTLVAT
jgi:hypothetical protein